MTLRPLPATIADVTPEWLTAALAHAPHWPGRPIVAVDARPVGGRDALASAVYAARVGVRTPGGAVEPVRLFVKLHHPDPSQRDDAGYAAEACFYRELAHRAGTPVPTTHFAEYDEPARRLVIVQEYLSDGRIGSSDRALPIEDLRRVLSSLAALHATWWNDPALALMTGVRPFDAAIRRAIDRLRNVDLDVRGFLDRFGGLVHPAVVDYYATMPLWMERVADGLSTTFTLVHLDCSAKNLFIPHDQRRDPVLFDWALFRSGNPALDLATLLCYSTDPAEHDRLPDLVRDYHGKLAAQGIRDYAYATLWDDFRLACLWRLAAPVANAAFGTAARDAHARTIIPLLDSAVLRSGALDLLEPP
jgi:aminoglycoside phosphotransferase (APT) family kinase protein